MKLFGDNIVSQSFKKVKHFKEKGISTVLTKKASPLGDAKIQKNEGYSPAAKIRSLYAW